MKGLKWVLCFALAAAFLWAAGTASARDEKATMLSYVTGASFGYDPKCGDHSQYFLFNFVFDGIDDCGGRFKLFMSVCTPWTNFLVGTQGTFRIEYVEGGTLSGTMDDMELVKLDNVCVLVPKPEIEIEITDGTGPFAGCTGHGDVVFYLNDKYVCGGDNLQLMLIDAKLKFHGRNGCPADKK
jgi:hypothetical protein